MKEEKPIEESKLKETKEQGENENIHNQMQFMNKYEEMKFFLREYNLFETTHYSSIPVTNKRWFPDKFIFAFSIGSL